MSTELSPEDYNADELTEEQEWDRDLPTITGGKDFDFSYFIEAKPGIVKDHPYDFSGFTVYNNKWESENKDKRLRKNVPRSDGYLNLATLETKRPYYYYFCGCIDYCSIRDAATITDMCICGIMEMPLDGHSEELKRGEPIYTVTRWINRKYGKTHTQRWRQKCWEKLEPILRQRWETKREQKARQQAKDYFEHNSVLNSEGEWVLDAHDRRKSTVSLHLSDEEAVERTQLVGRYSRYRYHRQSLVKQSKSLASVEALLNEIYTRVTQLGGVPSSWEYYDISATYPPIVPTTNVLQIVVSEPQWIYEE